jgi:hypothetical protein
MNNYTEQERIFMLYPERCMHYFINQLYTLEEETEIATAIEQNKGKNK